MISRHVGRPIQAEVDELHRIVGGITDKNKAELIREFVDGVMSAAAGPVQDPRGLFKAFIADKEGQDVKEAANEYNLSFEELLNLAGDYLRTADEAALKEKAVKLLADSLAHPTITGLSDKASGLLANLRQYREKYRDFVSL